MDSILQTDFDPFEVGIGFSKHVSYQLNNLFLNEMPVLATKLKLALMVCTIPPVSYFEQPHNNLRQRRANHFGVMVTP